MPFDFDRAKDIGLQNIRSWLPDGYEQGDEWFFRNPTRNDKNIGNASINLRTGKFIDRADDEFRGNDAVALYRLINAHAVESRARATGYKNQEGGAQIEAGKMILETYDMSYFPDPNEKIYEPKKSSTRGGYWDGFAPVGRGIDDAPDPQGTIDYNAKLFGEYVNKWLLTDIKNRPLLWIVRHLKDDGKKMDLPYVLWSDGQEYRWRCKKDSINFRLPLQFLPELDERPNDPFVLFEGQKKGHMARELLSDDFVCTSWYGGASGIDRTDFQPLVGRSGYFWPDADKPGKAVISKLKEIGVNVEIVFPPTGVKRGWGIDDAIDEGWTRQKLVDHIKSGGGRSKSADEYLDDDWPIKIVGNTATGSVAIYGRAKCTLDIQPRKSLTKGFLMDIEDRRWWGERFIAEKGGIAWDTAINEILRRADKQPLFHPDIIRGSGVWIDDGRVVANTGEKIICRGEDHELFYFQSKFLYEKKPTLPYSIDSPLQADECRKLIDILDSIRWKRREYPIMLAGWLFIAPFCGMLEWRPNCWITGSMGTGKSWIMENIVYPVLDGFAINIKAQASTAAGIRQALNNSNRPITADEMESDTQKKEEKTDEILGLVRQMSSGNSGAAKSVMGSADGSGQEWNIQSTFLMASISARIKHGADRSRMTILDLERPSSMDDQREQRFEELKEKVRIFTSAWSVAFHSRTLNIIDEVRRNIEIFCSAASRLMGSRRNGDQVGTLFGAAYMIGHDTAASLAEAMAWLERYEIEAINDQQDTQADEDQVMSLILESKIWIMTARNRVPVSIGDALKTWFDRQGCGIQGPDGADYSDDVLSGIRQELASNGIKPKMYGQNPVIQIAVSHSGLKKLLKDSAWSETYGDMLARLPYSDSKVKGPSDFAGSQKRFREFDAKAIFEEIPF